MGRPFWDWSLLPLYNENPCDIDVSTRDNLSKCVDVSDQGNR